MKYINILCYWALCFSPLFTLAQTLHITQNTTWTAAGSPYVLTDTLVIDSGVTLTLAAGTEVVTNFTNILNRGTLLAMGSATDSVILDGNFEHILEQGTQPVYEMDYTHFTGFLDFYDPNFSFTSPVDISLRFTNSFAESVSTSDYTNVTFVSHKSHLPNVYLSQTGQEGGITIDSSVVDLYADNALGLGNDWDVSVLNSQISLDLRYIAGVNSLVIDNCEMEEGGFGGDIFDYALITNSQIGSFNEAGPDFTFYGTGIVTIQNCTFDSVGISLEDVPISGSWKIEDCIFTDGKVEVRYARAELLRNTFEHTEVEVFEPELLELRASTFTGKYGGDIGLRFIDKGFQEVRVSGNEFQGWSYAIQIDEADTAGVFSITGNYFCDNTLNFRVLQNIPSFGLAGNCYCELDSAVIDAKLVSPGPIPFLPTATFCYANLVLPGDTDNNGVVNASDLFGIGLNFGTTGPVRPNATLDWIGQEGGDWGTNPPSGIDLKHIDADGNGVINADDTLGVSLNFGKTAQVFKTISSKADVFFGDLVDDPNDASRFMLPILWGSSDTTLSDMYGVSFDVRLNLGEGFGTQYALNLPANWLGDPASDLLSIKRLDSAARVISTGMVRFDQQGSSGSGQIAELFLQKEGQLAIEDLKGRIFLEHVQAINSAGEAIDIAGEELNFDPTSIVSTLKDKKLTLRVDSRARTWEVESEVPMESAKLMDLQGRTLSQQNNPATSVTFAYQSLASGIYVLQVKVKGETASWKVKVE